MVANRLPEIEWQIKLPNIKDRCQFLLNSNKLKDCSFFVGKPPNTRLISGHRFLLAIASPCLQRVLYSKKSLRNNTPIRICNVHPDAFKAMLDYIYTDNISISSFDEAWNLYCVAKSLMLPNVLIDHCINFLLDDLSPKNACRLYELGFITDQKRLIKSSMEFIAAHTWQVVVEPSFIDISTPTLIDIFKQRPLNIDSELDLFNILLKLAKDLGLLKDEEPLWGDEDKFWSDEDKLWSDEDKLWFHEELYSDLNNEENDDGTDENGQMQKSNDEDSTTETLGSYEYFVMNESSPDDDDNDDNDMSWFDNFGGITIHIINVKHIPIRKGTLAMAVRKIDFFSMTPEQFEEGPARSQLLRQNDAIQLLEAIKARPNNRSKPKEYRKIITSDHRYYLSFRSMMGMLYTNDDNPRLSFKVDTNIYLLGVQIKSENSNQKDINESVSACIEYKLGSEIMRTCTRYIECINDSIFELTFNCPVYIYENQNYNININNMRSIRMEVCLWRPETVCHNVKFSIKCVAPFGTPVSRLVFSTQKVVSHNLIKN